MSNVVFHTDRYLVMQTAESDEVFMPEGLFQIYERIPNTAEWKRLPDYEKTGTFQWYKTLESAKEAIEELSQRLPQTEATTDTHKNAKAQP